MSERLSDREVAAAAERQLKQAQARLAVGNLSQAIYSLLSAATWLSSSAEGMEGPGTFTYKIDKLRHEALHRSTGNPIGADCCEPYKL